MKKLRSIVTLTLALNFLAAAGAIAYLFQSGKLDRAKVLAIRELVFAPPPPPVDAPTTQPSEQDAAATTQPISSLEQLLAKASGRTAGEQVEFIQRSFDAQMALLDRRQRELTDLQRQVDLSKQQMQRDHEALKKDRVALAAQQQQAKRLATDKGFQDSLALYNTMPGKQVKTIFMSLDDATMMQYLQAMQPRSATRIIKEFKTPDEVARIQKVLESMRLAQQAQQQQQQSPPQEQQATAKSEQLSEKDVLLMKVEQLLPGSKSSSSSARASRGGAPEDAPRDFADALTEARKKPEAKPAEAKPPAVKKPATTKKGKPAVEDAESVPDEATVDGEIAEVVEGVASEAPVVDDDAVVEENATDAEEEAVLPELEVVPSEVGLTPVALAQVAGQQPVQQQQPIEATSVSEPVNVAPPAPAKVPAPSSPKPRNSIAADVEVTETPFVASDIAEAIVPPVEDEEPAAPEAPIALEELEVAPDNAPVPNTAPAKAPAAALIPAEPTDAHQENAAKQKEQGRDDPAPASLASELAFAAESTARESVEPVAKHAAPDTTSSVHVQPESAKPQATVSAPTAAPAPPPAPPQEHFVDANHPKIITAMRGDLLPNGGTMRIQLDPPELGALQVLVHMQDGVMTASFQTSNDDATKLLSHSLSQLKQVLESQGVSVEKLQVQQAPRDQHAQHDDPSQQHRDQHADAHRQEQQRKEMLRRMWRRLANGSDPLDLVA